MSRPTAAPTTLTKLTFETRFRIDFKWWATSGQELDRYLAEHLCEAHREALSNATAPLDTVDWIDPVTGEVTTQGVMTYWLLSHCSRQPDFITERTSLVDAVFRALIASGNHPMTPVELASITRRPADTILKTLSGKTVYKGLRPA